MKQEGSLRDKGALRDKVYRTLELKPDKSSYPLRYSIPVFDSIPSMTKCLVLLDFRAIYSTGHAHALHEPINNFFSWNIEFWHQTYNIL